MSIFSTRKSQVQEMRQRTQELEAKVRDLYQSQELLVKDILTLQETERAYKGNDYQEYDLAVQEISDKYCNLADWGCVQTGNIIDLRAAFILGEGIQVKPTTATPAEAEYELQWSEDFLTYNGLDQEMSQEIAKEAEIEGKVALNILYDADPYQDWPGMITTRFIPWTKKHYIVETDPADYLWYKKIYWDVPPAGSFDEPQFVYKKFGGRIYDPNDAQPKIMKCLTQIDRLDKALRDLRQINHLFASPTPDFEMPDAESVKKLTAELQGINWKIGKMIIHTGTFSLKTPEGAASSQGALIAEVETCIKMISGTTGVPIHFLGLLDLLKNRATGDNTRELVMAATSREREIWVGAFNELLEKSMTLFNNKAYAQMSKARKLDPTKVRIDIEEVSQEHWDRLEKVLIPAATQGIISKEYVASQIPGIDMDKERNLKAEADKREEEAAARELERLKAESANNNLNQGIPGQENNLGVAQ